MKNPCKKFWRNRKVLITGHTGFTGSWLALVLISYGAKVFGLSLKPNTRPSIYKILNVQSKIYKSYICDITDLNKVKKIVTKIKPSIIFHLAAQPLVKQASIDPVTTINTNIQGTLNICESSRKIKNLKHLLIVTSDKCYKNFDSKKIKFFKEGDDLNGNEPYAASKACAEILVNSYKKTFFKKNIALSTARAGNIIGGGDWAKDRIVPDIFRAIYNKKLLKVRYPNSTRPWQHVLDVVNGYILLSETNFSGAWNFGPLTKKTYTVKELIKYFQLKNSNLRWKHIVPNIENESVNLNLNVSKSLKKLSWKPKWNLEKSLENTNSWYFSYYAKKDINNFTYRQIKNYFNL